MTVAYLDASALVKLLLDEEGSDDVMLLVDAAAAVFANRLGDVEVAAALASARRAGRIDGAGLDHVLEQWSSFAAAVLPVELDEGIGLAAAHLALRHPLSGAEAVHLASALALVEAEPVVATWDARLHAAARAEGLATLPGQL